MILTSTENTPEAWSERAQHPDSWTACGWTQDGQLDRLDAALDELDPQPGERLLDWGSGTGALSDLVAPGVGYVGFDSAMGMVDRARREHPTRVFQSWEPRGEFDLVACIGPFNLPHKWSREMTWYTLRRLFERTTRMLVASLYAGDDTACLGYTEHECSRFARGQSCYSRAYKWRHNDVMVVLER